MYFTVIERGAVGNGSENQGGDSSCPVYHAESVAERDGYRPAVPIWGKWHIWTPVVLSVLELPSHVVYRPPFFSPSPSTLTTIDADDFFPFSSVFFSFFLLAA